MFPNSDDPAGRASRWRNCRDPRWLLFRGPFRFPRDLPAAQTLQLWVLNPATRNAIIRLNWRAKARVC
jgi:hypothetical protein